MTSRLAACLVLAASLLPAPARGGECPAIVGGSDELSGASASERLHFIREALSESARQSRAWAWGWNAGFAAISVGQLAIAPFATDEHRVDNFIGSLTPLVGIADYLIHPPSVIRHQAQLEREVAIARGVDVDPCVVLAFAERYLLLDADNETKNQAAFVRIGGMLYSLGIGLVLALGFHHYEAGAFNAAAGMVVGNLRMNTRPVASARALSLYRAGRLGSAPHVPFLRWFFGPMAMRDGYGLAGTLIF